jgi:hypothetical protein
MSGHSVDVVEFVPERSSGKSEPAPRGFRFRREGHSGHVRAPECRSMQCCCSPRHAGTYEARSGRAAERRETLPSLCLSRVSSSSSPRGRGSQRHEGASPRAGACAKTAQRPSGRNRGPPAPGASPRFRSRSVTAFRRFDLDQFARASRAMSDSGVRAGACLQEKRRSCDTVRVCVVASPRALLRVRE